MGEQTKLHLYLQPFPIAHITLELGLLSDQQWHNECNVLELSRNHPHTTLWKNCLPGNRSLVPKRLGTNGLGCPKSPPFGYSQILALPNWFCIDTLGLSSIYCLFLQSRG